DNLGHYVHRGGGRIDLPPIQRDHADCRIEMRATDRPEQHDQRGKCRNRRERICEQGHGGVSRGKTLGHDSRADHAGGEQQRAQRLGQDLARHHATSSVGRDLPILCKCSCNFTRSSVLNGRLVKILMRLSSSRNVCRNASHLSVSEPSTAAGSATPQWAVSGWPIHTGQASAAALSQTVNTKSRCGAPGFENSSQLLERMPSTGNFICFSSSSAIGCTLPLGELPAL